MNADPIPSDILVIDDNPNNLGVLSDMLREKGHHVRVAPSGRRGLDAARHTRPDLIMLDISMPDMDGFEVCKALRAEPRLAEVPVIFISAYDEEGVKVSAFEAGGADYVQKPFHSQEVLARVDHQLRLTRLQASLKAKNEALESLVAERTQELQAQLTSLQLSDARNRLIFDYSPEAILVSDLETQVIIEANPKAEELFGLTRDRLVGRHPADFYAEQQPDGLPVLESVRRNIERALQDQEPQFDRVVRRADGELRHCHVRLAKLPFPDRTLLMGTFIDVTERVRAEETKKHLESQLYQAQKMEALGRLAGGIAHDINNMLQAFLGHLDMLRDKLPGKIDALRHLDGMEAAADRSKEIVRKILAFSRKQVFTPQALDLNTHLTLTQKTLAPLLGEDVHMSFWPGEGLWRILADPSQVDQIIMNLAVNARDAMPDGGTITLETANRTLDEAHCEDLPQATPGDYVTLTVRDTGTGMDPETLERIFEPFFTTKEMGLGTGLGLSTVLGIAKQNGGFIAVESELGQGTSFHVFYPRHLGPLEAERAEKPKAHAPDHGRTILLVEDDPLLRNVITTVVQKLGYEALVADSPEEALEFAAQPDRQIDILLTDVIMPGMNGKELKDQFDLLRPGTPTLFMSGYTAEIIAKRGILEAGHHLIRKPFRMEELAEKLQTFDLGPAPEDPWRI